MNASPTHARADGHFRIHPIHPRPIDFIFEAHTLNIDERSNNYGFIRIGFC